MGLMVVILIKSSLEVTYLKVRNPNYIHKLIFTLFKTLVKNAKEIEAWSFKWLFYDYTSKFVFFDQITTTFWFHFRRSWTRLLVWNRQKNLFHRHLRMKNMIPTCNRFFAPPVFIIYGGDGCEYLFLRQQIRRKEEVEHPLFNRWYFSLQILYHVSSIPTDGCIKSPPTFFNW